MNKITLTICIATLNRSAFIGETLESIIKQATEEVEIVIVDGASSDNTEQIALAYQKQCSRVRYFRQQTNLGVDRDYNKAVEISQGEYCWLMSDDDILKPGAIQAILKATRHDYPLMIVNAEVRNSNLTTLLDKQRLGLSGDRIYHSADANDFFKDTAFYLSFIGCIVIKKSIWTSRDKEKYYGSLFIHVGVIFQAPIEGDILVIARPWVIIRFGNAGWTSRSFEIWMFKWPHLIWSFSDYSDSAKRQVCPKEHWRKYRTLLLYRANGAFSVDEYNQWLEPRLNSWVERTIVKTIAKFPGWILNLLGVVYFSTIYQGSGMQLENLKRSHFYYPIILKNMKNKRILPTKPEKNNAGT